MDPPENGSNQAHMQDQSPEAARDRLMELLTLPQTSQQLCHFQLSEQFIQGYLLGQELQQVMQMGQLPQQQLPTGPFDPLPQHQPMGHFFPIPYQQAMLPGPFDPIPQQQQFFQQPQQPILPGPFVPIPQQQQFAQQPQQSTQMGPFVPTPFQQQTQTGPFVQSPQQQQFAQQQLRTQTLSSFTQQDNDFDDTSTQTSSSVSQQDNDFDDTSTQTSSSVSRQNDYYDYMREQEDLICEEVDHLYKHTNMTASECMEILDRRLLEKGTEPDCVPFWQEMNTLQSIEGAWDDWTPEEQAEEALVPKGKKRKFGLLCFASFE